MGSKWRDVADRRPHVAVLAALLIALFAGAGVAPGAVISFRAPGPVSLLAPSLTGDARVGGTLSCTRGTWDDSDREPYDIEYQWFHELGAIKVGAARTHVVSPEDAGETLVCQATARDGWLHARAGSDGLDISGPIARSAPVLSGDDRIGHNLSCTRGIWDDRGMAQPYAVAYAWLRDDDPIAGETTSTHNVTPQDAGHAIVCEVTAASAGSADTGAAFPDGPRNHVPPQLGGDPRVGGVVTCSSGGWDDSYPFSYQWRRDGAAIALATQASYRVDPLDIDHDLSCRVTAAGLHAADSGVVEPQTPSSQNAPQVTGDLRLGGTLTCEPGRWDADYTLTYAWSSGDKSATHTNVVADLGQPLACTVTAQ